MTGLGCWPSSSAARMDFLARRVPADRALAASSGCKKTRRPRGIRGGAALHAGLPAQYRRAGAARTSARASWPRSGRPRPALPSGSRGSISAARATQLSSTLDQKAALHRVAELVVREFAELGGSSTRPTTETSSSAPRLARVDNDKAGGRGPGEQPESGIREVVEGGRLRLAAIGKSSTGAKPTTFLDYTDVSDHLRVAARPAAARRLPSHARSPAPSSAPTTWRSSRISPRESPLPPIAGASTARWRSGLTPPACSSTSPTGSCCSPKTASVRLWNPAAEAIISVAAGDVVGQAASKAIPGWRDAAESVPVFALPIWATTRS